MPKSEELKAAEETNRLLKSMDKKLGALIEILGGQKLQSEEIAGLLGSPANAPGEPFEWTGNDGAYRRASIHPTEDGYVGVIGDVQVEDRNRARVMQKLTEVG